MIAETVTIPAPKTACDGDGTSPHPRVFLAVGERGFVDCPYCGRRFVLQKSAASGNAH